MLDTTLYRLRVLSVHARVTIIAHAHFITSDVLSSILQFLDKMKKWEDMCNLPVDFRHKVDRLERNFNVCSVLFKKYQPIFRDVFQDPSNDAPKQPRIRKQR